MYILHTIAQTFDLENLTDALRTALTALANRTCPMKRNTLNIVYDHKPE